MVSRFLRKKSKRKSTKDISKIKKRVVEHHRKIRKAKKLIKSRKRKDPGVPNNYPFKEEILQDAAEWKRKKDEERELKKQERKDAAKKLEDIKRTGVTGIIKDIESRTDEYNRKRTYAQMEYQPRESLTEMSLKQYYKEFRKVVEASDVILQVLDARDPLGSRCKEVEKIVLESGKKKLVLVLNKIDLIPKENIFDWLTYLRRELPTIAFRSSTQAQQANLSQHKTTIKALKRQWLQKTKVCLGADALMSLLGNYSRNNDMRTSITVGVVGFPNTGKSSLINSLKREKACSSGPHPGITKQMKEVVLDSHIKLIDSPGVVFAKQRSEAVSVLSNCVTLMSVEDPIPPVNAILKRCSKVKLMEHYKIEEYKDVDEFLAFIAYRFNFSTKLGIPNLHKAGKRVLQDWNRGRISYYTQPPKVHIPSPHLDAKIVTELKKEFDINSSHIKTETTEISSMDDRKPQFEFMASPISNGRCRPSDPVIKSEGDSDMEEQMESAGEDDEDNMDVDDHMADKIVTFQPKRKRTEANVSNTKKPVDTGVKTYGKMTTRASKVLTKEESDLNPQRASAMKKLMRQKKKDKKRLGKASEKLADSMQDAFSGLGEKYDFAEAFK